MKLVFHQLKSCRDPITRSMFPLKKHCEFYCRSSSRRFKNSPAFSNNKEKIILLQLCYDGVGITNPLRGASTIHNCGMFYFTILNLPPRYNASIHNIHTVAVCNSLDLKCPSALDILLERIVDEIERLSRDGMEIEINNNTVQVFVQCVTQQGLKCRNLRKKANAI